MTDSSYGLLPFRFGRIPRAAGSVLITSEAGEHLFLSEGEFSDFVSGRLSPDTATSQSLESKHFLYRGSPDTAVRLLATKLRSRKSFIRSGPALHIFVVTLRCDHGCHYCQVSRQSADRHRFDMTPETVESAVVRLFESPSRELTVEFQGGEPLLAFPIIRSIVERIEQRNAVERRTIIYTITSTLQQLTDEVLAFFREHEFRVSTSLDGPKGVHNQNRPNPTGDAYERTLAGVTRAREAIGADKVAALTTITRRSLAEPEAIVDEYVAQGFRSIFLRPLSPFGFAVKSARKTGYSTEEFTAFYERALQRIIEINLAGTYFEEAYAALVLRSILTPFPTSYVDLRSPVGAAFGVLVYNYDGGVYASDESRMLAEMGDDSFRLGHVSQPYSELMQSNAVQLLMAAGLSESLPGCSDCVFVNYCGPDPVTWLAQSGHPVTHQPSTSHCRRHMALFQMLFRLLATAEPDVRRVLVGWAFQRSAGEVRSLA